MLVMRFSQLLAHPASNIQRRYPLLDIDLATYNLSELDRDMVMPRKFESLNVKNILGYKDRLNMVLECRGRLFHDGECPTKMFATFPTSLGICSTFNGIRMETVFNVETDAYLSAFSGVFTEPAEEENVRILVFCASSAIFFTSGFEK